MSNTENPRAIIGGNEPPLAKRIGIEENFGAEVTDYLEDEYRELVQTSAALLDEARGLPQGVNDEPMLGVYATLIKRLRDTAKRAEAFHAKEKEPYLRGGQAVDGFFFSLWDKLARRNRTNKPGAADVLQARVDDYMQRKLAAEQEARRVAAEAAARAAREAQEKADAERRAAEAARLAAERARKPDTQAAKGAVASLAEGQASGSRVEADLATDKAQAAHIDTLAKPADMVRTRVDGGPTVTMARESYAIVTDSSQLDKEALWPFIAEGEKEKALRAWARTKGFAQQMAGAEIGSKPKTAIR